MSDKKIWFKAKTYGWGWTPATWQGWALTGLYLVATILLSIFIGDGFESRAGATTFCFLMVLFTVPFLYVCYIKGEKPGWRWGNKKKSL